MAKTVLFSLDDLPPITEEERRRFRELEAKGDAAIDFSDIPASTDTTWQHATRGKFFRPVKQQVTLRLDSNTLDWFKRHTPKGYQTDINRVLSDYVARQEKKAG